MSEIAKPSLTPKESLTPTEIAAFAETAPGVPGILGWLASQLDSYVYLAKADGTPTFHAGHEREGEAVISAVPGEEFSLCVVGSVDPDLLSHLALMVSGALARERADAMAEAKSHGDALRSFIAGEAEAPERAKDLGWDVDREVFVVMGRFNQDLIPTLAAQWRSFVRQRDPKGLVFFFPSEIVAVLGGDSLDPHAIAEALPRGGGEVGVSRTGVAASHLGDLYRQAELALSVAQSIGRKGGAYGLDDLGVYRLMSLIDDSEAIRNFLKDSLGELAERIDLESNDLRRTLQTLLDHNLNIAETARDLHFHYNTLRYRIAKLEKMVGPFTSDPELRLSLSLALRIFRLRNTY